MFGDDSGGGEWPAGQDGRVPNLSKAFVEAVAEKTGMEFVSEDRKNSRTQEPKNARSGKMKDNFTPEDVFYWIYGVFHSPQYRERYAEFLKIDFPRVPLPKDGRQFAEVCAVGRDLVGLHLMESEELDDKKQFSTFPEKGTGEVEAGYPRYIWKSEKEKGKGQKEEDCGRVYINEGQYFEGVEPAVWEFTIGGYQVCEKWLKDRRGRALSFDDIQHYQKIVVALRETMRLMNDERLRIFG